MTLGIIAFIVAFLLLIAIHEAGHFIAAKSAGVAVRTFSIGMGPKIASFTPKNTPNPTTYQLAALPIGGYCGIAGMTNLDDADDVDEDAVLEYRTIPTLGAVNRVRAAPTSTPRVGSSRISTFGRVISPRAMATFCWLPPESCPAS